MFLLTEDISLSDKKIKSIVNDAEKSAAAANLIYVSDSQPGIRRLKRGKKFVYVSGKKPVRDEAALQRIKRLVIPPAWENVWICSMENGHLQVTGTDIKRRKQYKYHPLWNSIRNHTKFYRLHAFGRVIPSIRQQIEKDLSLPGIPLEKVLATVVCLMEKTCIRVGNSLYEKLYGSFGLTTLKDKHVKIEGANMQFVFRGKKGISHRISIKNKRLARIVKQCRDIPGKELFQYIDDKGERRCIDSGMVNDYLKRICGGEDFTAKDFRTWAGTVQALGAFKELGPPQNITQTKKNIVMALDMVAEHLGNTRTVCKKYYVHPIILSLYEKKRLHGYFSEKDNGKHKEAVIYTPEERTLMKILERESSGVN
jgi:DNA topoisomerase I